MQHFNAKVRLGGSPMNEVLKADISAAEVQVLQALHGHDAVVDLEWVGDKDLSAGEVDEVIATRYGNSKIGEPPQPVIEAVFGRARNYPKELPRFEGASAKKGGKKAGGDLLS